MYDPAAGAYLHASDSRKVTATFTPADTADFVIGGTVSASLDVTPVNLLITADDQAVPQGLVLPTLTWHANLVAGDTSSSLTAKPVCSTTATTDATLHVTSPLGTYPITCAGATDPDYVIAYSPGTLTVQPGGLVVTINASGPYGSTPRLSNLSPTDRRIGYSSASDGANVTGTLTCTTTATSSSPAQRYPVSTCGGLSNPDHTILYDYASSGYTVTLAPVVLVYTGRVSIGRAKPVTLSVTLTSRVTGLPIAGRVLLMQIGRGHLTRSFLTRKKNAAGQVSCVDKFVMPYKSPTPLRLRFFGDPPGPNYDYASGHNKTPIIITS